jgi:hypothetical protein
MLQRGNFIDRFLCHLCIMTSIQQADSPTIGKRGKHYQDYILYEVPISLCAFARLQMEQKKIIIQNRF